MIRHLGSFEKALRLTDLYAPFNVICVVQLTDPPPPEVLHKALGYLQAAHPLLQAFIIASGRRPYFEQITDLRIPFQVIFRQEDTHWLFVAQEIQNMRIDVTTGPLFECVYVYPRQGDENSGEIILKFHHTIADAVCTANFIHDLLDLCHRLRTGSLFTELPRLPVFPAIDNMFPTNFQGFGRVMRMVVYGLGQLWDELCYYWRVRGKRKPPVRAASRLMIATHHIPETLTSALASQARKKGLTLYSLVSSAVLIAVHRHLYGNTPVPLRTFAFADLRPYTDPPLAEQHFGSSISMLRYLLEVEQQQDIWKLAEKLNRMIYTSFKKGDKFASALMSESLIKLVTRTKMIRMGTTGVSYFSVTDLQPHFSSSQVTAFYGFAPNIDLGPEFSAMVNLYADQLWWGFTYFEDDMDNQKAQGIIAEIRNLLEVAV